MWNYIIKQYLILMENLNYFYMELVNDEVMVNTYAIPDSTFGLNNQTDFQKNKELHNLYL